MDMTVTGDRLPNPGETVLGTSFAMHFGGKGANQAVAAARLSTDTSQVRFVAAVGKDTFATSYLNHLVEEGLSTQFIEEDHHSTGIALISVDSSGCNSINVYPGANMDLSSDLCERALQHAQSNDVVLIQLEIPPCVVDLVSRVAREKGLRLILNPAPARALSDEILESVYALTPNQSEAEFLTGIPCSDVSGATKAAQVLQQKGARNVIVTLGGDGAIVLDENKRLTAIKAPSVDVIDTTAAGDCFNAALAIAILEGNSIADASAFACQAASLSVSKPGAQESAPYRVQLKQVNA